MGKTVLPASKLIDNCSYSQSRAQLFVTDFGTIKDADDFTRCGFIIPSEP
jgi:hypothetical protein